MPSPIPAPTPEDAPASQPTGKLTFPSGRPVQMHAFLTNPAAHILSQDPAPPQPSPRARAQPLFDLGMTCLTNGQPQGAIAAFRQATEVDPHMSEAWRKLGDVSLRVGDAATADQAYVAYAAGAGAGDDPELAEASVALEAGKIGIAERILIQRMQKAPNDVAAMRLLAESRMLVRRYADTETLLARVLELAPSFARARHNYAVVLFRQGKIEPAVEHLERLRASDPGNVNYQMLLASCLTLIGQHRRAIGIYETIVQEWPNYADGWLGYGNALRYTGRRDDAVRAYRAALTYAPTRGEAYWNIANLKTETLSPDELAFMQAQVADNALAAKDRMLIHFALGESFEKARDFVASFNHYAAGAKLRRAQISYSADEHTDLVRRMMEICSPAMFAARALQQTRGTGPTPIFIVGMPRAGSTLVEQILASHSAVEGTQELPEIGNISRHLAARRDAAPYPDCLSDLTDDDIAALGTRYIENTCIFRTVGRAYFIDKMPPNWLHCGLIHLILPGAKIIDVRRAPMASCFAAYKQYFGHGQNASYDLTEIGRHYIDYVTLMTHFDQVLPGRIHRVLYEDLINHTESETRRLLDYCGLPFEPACLRFWETTRDVATPSSEQVRQPIFREGLEQWRHYESWLGPLQDVLHEHGMN